MRYGVPDWDAAVAALEAAPDVVLGCHVNPDGDALGSLLGATLGLKRLGKEVHPVLADSGARVPSSYAFLPGSDLLLEPHQVPDAETFVALDCGGIDRLGEAETKAKGARCLLNIDHHPGNDGFGHLNVVVTTASSTSELVAWLLADAGVEIDRDVATCLYTGIVTDTGRFSYSNSTPETLRLAADLLARGVDAPSIAREVFESSPFGYLKLVGRVLDRAQLFEREGFVYSWITVADLGETGVALDETEKLIDLIRSTRAADVAAMFKEQPDGSFRVSLRSKGPRSVGAIARDHGGGGHELAAGFTTSAVAQGVEAILARLRRGRS